MWGGVTQNDNLKKLLSQKSTKLYTGSGKGGAVLYSETFYAAIPSTKIKRNGILSYLSDVSSYWINLQLTFCWISIVSLFKHNTSEKIFNLFPFVITLILQKNKQKAASLGLSQLHKPSNCRKGHLDDISAGWLIWGCGVDSVRAPESLACQ